MSWYGPHPKPGANAACATCGKSVYGPPSRPRKFCSHKCYSVAKLAKNHDAENRLKRCARCHHWKPYADFVKSAKASSIGLAAYCKPCSSTVFHELRGTPPEQRKAYRPAYKLSPEEKRLRLREIGRRQHQARRAGGSAPPKYALGKIICEQDARCAYCGVLLDKYHVDHKTPVSKGGTNDLSNLHLTCPRCNMRKGAMTHEEFLASKRRPVRTWT